MFLEAVFSLYSVLILIMRHMKKSFQLVQKYWFKDSTCNISSQGQNVAGQIYTGNFFAGFTVRYVHTS